MGSKGSAPKPPSPEKTASAQTQAGITSGIANNLMGMVNQYGPNGESLTYTQTGTKTVTDPATGKSYEVPQYRSDYSGGANADEASLDQARAASRLSKVANERATFLQGHLSSALSSDALPWTGKVPISSGISNTSGMGTKAGEGIARSYGPADGYSADRQRVEDALMQRMQPSLDRDRDQMQTMLANQGIGMGTEAYGSAQDDFSRGVNDARLGAILAGGQEQSRLDALAQGQAGFQNAAQGQAFGQGLQALGFDNAAQGQRFGQDIQTANLRDTQRQNAMAEQFAYRSQPINEITALLSGGQISSPQFQGFQPAQMPTPDVAGLINSNYQQNNANWQQQQQNRSSLFGNLLGAGGALGAAFLSDARRKTDIRHVGARGGIPIYEYRYRHDPPGVVRRGYLAQEVARIVPQAVVRMGAWLGLDYAQLPEVA